MSSFGGDPARGGEGERVFTAQWGDSAPLFYFAPQLESLVVLDPTFFLAKDPELFETYVTSASSHRRSLRVRWSC